MAYCRLAICGKTLNYLDLLEMLSVDWCLKVHPGAKLDCLLSKKLAH